MSDKEDSGQAFPCAGSEHGYPVAGMTLRDYFAAKAMHMFHGTDITCERDIRRRFEFTDSASLAYQYADAMLAERAK